MTNLNYVLGLDLGIASVGWAVVEINEQEEPTGLIDVGVRTFEAAENPKNGESLALGRRLARASRRLIARRKDRLKKGKRLLKQYEILTQAEFELLKTKALFNSPWQLRLKGLDEKLERQEWATVLLHLLKRRGYLSQRKSELKDKDKEKGKLLSGIGQNSEMLKSGEYRSPAELALKKFEPDTKHIRNKSGEYIHSFSRLDLINELHLLFAKQREFGNAFAPKSLEEEWVKLLLWQKPALSGDAILKTLGIALLRLKNTKRLKIPIRQNASFG